MKKTLYILLLIPFIGLSQGSIIWDTDFDSVQWSIDGNPALQIWEQDFGAANLVGNSREGTGCVSLAMEAAYNRNEMHTDELYKPAYGIEFWWGFSFKVVTPIPSSRIFHQIRSIGTGADKSVCPIAFRAGSSGNFTVWTATNESFYNSSYPQWYGAGTETINESGTLNYTLNQWQDIVIYWKPNSAGNSTDGIVRVWHNGDLVVDKVNTTVLYRQTDYGNLLDDAFSPKIGPYTGSLSRVGEIHYDTFKVWEGAGGTYEDVSPLGLSPGGGGTPPIDVTAAKVWPTSDKMLVAGTRQAYYETVPTNATIQTGVWSTSNGSVATVNSSTGLITAQGVGTCTITWTSDDTTNGTITDTTSITVESSSTEDSIMILEPYLYLTPTSGDADSWDDTSGFELHGTEVGTITFTDQATFDGSSYYDIEDSGFLDFTPGTDEFTVVYREGDTAPFGSGYAVSKMDGNPDVRQYGAMAYNDGIERFYAGGLNEAILNPPLDNNKLVFVIFETNQVNVWVDGVNAITNSTAIGTATAVNSVNIGGRSDGSYMIDNGGTLDLVSIIPKAISAGERVAIETEFQVNGTPAESAAIQPSGFNYTAPYFYLNGTTKKPVKN